MNAAAEIHPMVTIKMIPKKWGSNGSILVLLKSMTSHRFTIIDGKVAKTTLYYLWKCNS